MDRIGIIGLGLIGGSIAKSLFIRKKKFEIVAFDCNEDYLTKAYNENVIDDYTSEINEKFKNCKVIFICTPVDTICSFVKKLLPFIDDCIITDVGSTKNKIFEDMKNFDTVSFIGGHPMAGSEKNGYFAAKDFLFENAYYILTPSDNITDTQYLYLENIIKYIGAIPITIPPTTHDYIVAAISHVPHVIAASLVNCVNVLDTEERYMHHLAAGGFKDITRIASSNPSLWNSICLENKVEILKILSSFKKQVEIFESNLIGNDTFEFFESSKDYRDTFVNTKSNIYNFYELKVDVLDKPGSIATVSTLLSVNGINIKNIGIINNREFENGVLSVIFENKTDIDSGRKLLEEMNFTIYS